MTSARTSAGQPADDRPDSAAAGQPAADAPLRPAARRAIVASVIGTVIEWYDCQSVSTGFRKNRVVPAGVL